MPTRDVTITNATGLHARPAAKFVEIASRFRSQVAVHKNDQIVNGKSVWDMLTLDAAAGTMLRLEVEGEDAEECLAQLTELLRDPDNERADA